MFGFIRYIPLILNLKNAPHIVPCKLNNINLFFMFQPTNAQLILKYDKFMNYRILHVSTYIIICNYICNLARRHNKLPEDDILNVETCRSV